MEKEKYAKLFKAIVGRELTPQQFLQARASDFDPKQIKKIAGVVAEPDVDKQAAESNGNGATELTQTDLKAREGIVTQPVVEVRKLTSKKKVPTKWIIAILACIVVAAGIFGFVKSRPVDVTKDIKVTFSGYDGYGTASYNSKKVHQVITEKLAVKAGFSKAESHKLISKNYLSDYLTIAKYRTKATKLMKWISELKITFDVDSNLRNGDKVTFKVKPEKGTPLKAIEKTYKVKGLEKPKIIPVNKLIEDEISFSGYNGNGYVYYDDSKFELISSDESGALSNGDTLEFEFTPDYLDTLLTEGKTLTDKTFNIEVTDLKDINEISKVDTLYRKIPDLAKAAYQDEPAGESDAYNLTYKIEPQKSFIKVFEDDYDDETYLSVVITYKITKTQTWVKDDTWDKKKKGDVETKEAYTYLGYQNVEVYKNAVVLSDLSETSGSFWSNYLDIDAVYADLEKSGFGEYQPSH